MVIGQGYTDRYLADHEVRAIVRESLDSLHLDDKRVLIIIADGTRSMPMPLMFSLFHELLDGRVRQLDYLVALGTLQPMTDAQLGKLTGQPVMNGRVGTSRVFNHEWQNPAATR